MADIMETCANPGCMEPGTNKCSACKTTLYCSIICQRANWPLHKESCPGHLRKMGMAHLQKAKGFHGVERNYEQAVRCAELALTKLKQLKDRSLAFIQILDEALETKYGALSVMGRDKEALECATERYNMWATTNMRHPGMIEAAFPLIESLLHNHEFAQAHLIAGTVHEMAMHPTNHDIPENKQQPFLAQSANCLALATHQLAQAGGIPANEKQKAGKEAIALARKGLEMHKKLPGVMAKVVALNMATLAGALDYFNNVDDNEPIRLYEQVIYIFTQVVGSSSVNIPIYKQNLGNVYCARANRAVIADDLKRALVNWELAVSYLRDAIRLFRAINHMGPADIAALKVAQIEENLRLARI